MKWYVVVKVFFVFWAQFGPYEDRDACAARMVELYNQGMSRYNVGERVKFMGKEVSPDDVTLTCKLKKK